MVKKKQTKLPPHVLLFVEGDTDEVFFKALIDYYASVSTQPLLQHDVCNLKGVTRYSSKLLAKLKNEYLPMARNNGYAIKTVCCSYDTDVFEVKQPQIVKWDAIGKSIKRMGIEEFIRVGVKSSIEDWILDDVSGICQYLHLKQVPSGLKGANGYQKMLDLYSKARRTYKKGYETKELISSLNMRAIREKRKEALAPLENALGVVLP
ncbi:hypothetical protein JN06_02747 [Bacteroides zoogleoformans]|uniref:RloB-like protein n=1 Tax=Bacteroides zoogleoformans TaxID=28119 RepID=A0ABM6T8S8_9BACE|nr:hypothetical protein [Bacteroides zoogleoformans]AVM53099.1 hypothetical protein C4H11_09280 [Bacteroides zoogleoformans]TWJ08038.1 hypothetical protein JN06_02747 [Bacteroides zoogleoformans]